jgi:hypothetical protein
MWTMMRQARARGSIARLILGLAALALLPGGLAAETVNVLNDTKAAVVVQIAYVVNGKVVRDKPVPLKSGAAVPLNTLPGIKLISIYDASRPDRELHRSTLPASKTDQSYVISPNATGKGIVLEPVKPMAGGPGGGGGADKGTKPGTEPPPKSGGLPPK